MTRPGEVNAPQNTEEDPFKDWSPGPDGGFNIQPNYYRVPDLLTKDQFIAYMWTTYGERIEFLDKSAGAPEVYGDPDRQKIFADSGQFTGPVDPNYDPQVEAEDTEDEDEDYSEEPILGS